MPSIHTKEMRTIASWSAVFRRVSRTASRREAKRDHTGEEDGEQRYDDGAQW